MRALRLLPLVIVALPAAARAATGARAGPISFATLVQTRYTQVFPAEYSDEQLALRPPDRRYNGQGWLLRRARLKVYGDPGPAVSFEVDVDFADATRTRAQVLEDGVEILKDATIQVRPHRVVGVTLGRFKRPFSALELRGSRKLEVAERGPGNDLARDLGFAGRDVGMMLTVRPLRDADLLALDAGAFAGNIQGEDAGPAGSLAARVTGDPIKWLGVGASWAWRPDRSGDPGYPPELKDGVAFGGDAVVRLGKARVRAEVLSGQRTDVDVAGAEDLDVRWLGATVLASMDLSAGRIDLEPALKGEMLDQDARGEDDMRFVLTAAVNLRLARSVRLLVQGEHTFTQDLTRRVGRDWGTRVRPDVAGTSVLAQLQIDVR